MDLERVDMDPSSWVSQSFQKDVRLNLEVFFVGVKPCKDLRKKYY